MPKISKRTVDALKLGTSDVFLWDDALPGFGVRAKPSGAKSFLLQYRNRNGRSRRYTIGRYGVLTPDEARDLARSVLAEVAAGGDPAETRSQERKASNMAELCREYLEKAQKGLIHTKRGRPKKASTLYIDHGRVERHIIPLLGKRSVKDVTSADIRGLLRDVISGKTAADVKTKDRGRAIVSGGQVAASRTVSLLGAIFTYAVNEGYRADNPVRGVVRPADKRRQIHQTEGTYAALRELLKKAEEAGESWQALLAVEVIALTGCRRGEIQALKRSEVDIAGQALRLGDSKTGASIRPIGKAALAVLKTAIERCGESAFVFPAIRSGGTHFAGLPKAWNRIVGDHLKLTPHGLRHAFASTAEELGFTLPTISALLGHAGGSVTHGYVHKIDSALISAANRISEHIRRSMDQEPAEETSNVIALSA